MKNLILLIMLIFSLLFCTVTISLDSLKLSDYDIGSSHEYYNHSLSCDSITNSSYESYTFNATTEKHYQFHIRRWSGSGIATLRECPCYVRYLHCPTWVIVGTRFIITFNFYGTGPIRKYEYRSLWRNDTRIGAIDTRIDCRYGVDHPDCMWHYDFFDTIVFAPGTYNYTVKCHGAPSYLHPSYCDYSDYSESCIVTAISPPSVNIDSPLAGSWQKSDFTLQYDATSDVEIHTCKLFTKEGVVWIDRGSITCGTDRTVTITVGSGKYCSVQGLNKCGVRIWANDTYGGTDQAERFFSIDYTSPSGDITHSPSSPSALDVVTYTAIGSDAISRLEKIEIYVDDSLKHTCTTSPCVYEEGPYTAGSTHSYYAKIYDYVNNIYTTSTKKFIVSTIPDEYLTIILFPGWNMISFPFKQYTIVQINDAVYRKIFSWNAQKNNWDILDISEASLRGVWVYSYSQAEIKIKGIDRVRALDINLYHLKERKDTPNQIPIPYRGININSEKGSCEITRFYYYNVSEPTWYKWNATTQEFLRWNVITQRYELIRIDPDPFIPPTRSIYLYTKNNCQLRTIPPSPP